MIPQSLSFTLSAFIQGNLASLCPASTWVQEGSSAEHPCPDCWLML